MNPSSLLPDHSTRKQTPVAAGRQAAGLIRSFVMVGLVTASVGMGNASLAAPVELGRLFFTPFQRAQLESARAHNVTQPASRQKYGSPDGATPPLRFDGTVIRSDGKTTRWVDGKPQLDGSGVAGLKPGQIRANGKVYEPYQVLRPTMPGPAVPEAKKSAP
jgi:hypothetical protein